VADLQGRGDKAAGGGRIGRGRRVGLGFLGGGRRRLYRSRGRVGWAVGVNWAADYGGLCYWALGKDFF
jgi:hypothetical protein